MTKSDDLTIKTRSGPVKGQIHDGVRTWFGVLYAAAPVGALRFRAPEPPPAWESVRDADSFGPLPLQKRGFEAIGGAGATTPMSEDCLTLNISAPLKISGKLKPVVVWIYGGGFTLGGSRSPLYRGNHLVEDGDVVYVSFNYRVGFFGFADFSRWGTPGSPIDTNLSQRDQIAALTWVQQNIRAFGGDPDRVTIFGQSAGAACVTYLMCVPAAHDLFHRAFAMSPSALSVYGSDRHALFARDLVSLLGVDPDNRDATNHALKIEDGARLIEAVSQYYYDIAPDKYPGMLPSSPVIDGDILPKHPIEAFQDGSAMKIPLVIGTMSREGAMLDKALPVIPTRANRLEAMFAEPGAGSFRDRIADVYRGFPSKKRAIDIGGDFTFWLPALQIAEGHSKHADCWSYRFDYATLLTRLVFGEATHGLDLPMVFGTTGEGELGRLDLFYRRRSKAVGHRFRTLFTQFAHGKNPDWDRYDTASRMTRIFDHQDRTEGDPRQERRLAWGIYRGPA
ncbi:para-nitrobenzyl esterase [Rhizobium sp. SG_E_25_P2]|uniref:carboxylesterase/lipase family protein n=1 Tax=Rhizobium sp. SG_E_25_P2 TaxID=2879942 RepID=UPI0024760941|nr:carboxylesterase/lipase family protein [Rhizobium sp. SG_E_25_P2]MDH6266001.1 para-nitrobenzyl esterase [Rhizobium sp. SG_E_25_P2]